jgi:hypothetical protein
MILGGRVVFGLIYFLGELDDLDIAKLPELLQRKT